MLAALSALAVPALAGAAPGSLVGQAIPPPPPGCQWVEGAVLELGQWQFARWACADGQRLLLGQVLPGSGNPPQQRIVDERRLPTPGPRRSAKDRGAREMEYALCVNRASEGLVLAAIVWENQRNKKSTRHAGWEGLWGFDLAQGRIVDVKPEQVTCEVLNTEME